MPELPEVETTKNLLEPYLINNKIVSIQLNRANLRYPFPDIMQTGLENVIITEIKRHGKYMLWHCDNDYTIIVHLGMSGRFLISHQHCVFPDFYHDYNINPKHEHCVINFSNGKRISYYDPRRFGFFDAIETENLYQNKFLKVLGIDGLSLKGNENVFYNTIKSKKTAIKNLLLNQSIIAGVGNIYASEALWRTKIHPETLGNKITQEQINFLSHHIHNILHESIHGGGSTLKDYRKPNGETGQYQMGFNVYDKTGLSCPDKSCEGIIKKIVQSKRASFFCNKCQYITV